MIASAAAAHLSFGVGATRAAVPLSIVREVVQAPDIVRVPGSHRQVAGVTLRAGIAVPVYDLRRHAPLWTRPEEAARAAEDRLAAEHLIICGAGEVVVGLLAERVDLLEGSLAFSEEAVAEAALRAEYLRGHLRSLTEVVALLDPAKLFASLGVPEGSPPPAMEDEGEEDPAGR